jgi:hypothetical protein
MFSEILLSPPLRKEESKVRLSQGERLGYKRHDVRWRLLRNEVCRQGPLGGFPITVLGNDLLVVTHSAIHFDSGQAPREILPLY